MAGDTALGHSGHKERLALYRRGLDRIESRRDVLSGEPVFLGTRLSVRHIGGMLLAGVPACEIQEDYPYISGDDIIFAGIYAGMNPAPDGLLGPLRIVRATDG